MKLKRSAPRPATAVRSGVARSLRFAAALVLSAAGTIALPTAPASAACVQAGNVVTCSGATNTGFGTGTENGLSLTVQPGASITVGASQIAVNLANGNTALNNGSITTGNNGIGMQGLANNSFTNAGTITLGSGSSAMFVAGSNNVVINTGTITSSAFNGVGIDMLGSGNSGTNSGVINLAGTGSYGISADDNNTVLNSGSITIGASGTNGTAVSLSNNDTLTNTGTVTAAGADSIGVSMFGSNSTVTNNGTIRASGLNGIAIGFVGDHARLINNGTIAGGSAGYALFTFGTLAANVTNNGTLDGSISLVGSGNSNSLTNNGLITISDPATQLFTGNLGVSGTFSQSAAGTLVLRVDNSGAHDGLFASNQASLGGTLRAVLQSGLYQSSTTYTNVVQTAGTVSGQFSSVTTSSAFFNAAANYKASSVDLTLTRLGFGSVAGETANQRAVGNAMEAGYSTTLTGKAATFYSNLLQAGSVRVLDQLSGEGTSGTQNAAFTAGAQFGQTMDGQMNAWRAGGRTGNSNGGAIGYAEERPVTSAFAALKAPPLAQPLWDVWASGFGASQSLSGNAMIGSAGFSDRIAGGSMGVDHLLTPDLLVGIAAGGSSASFSMNDRATSGRLDGGHVGAYAMQRFGASYVSAQLAYSHFNNSTTRRIAGIGPDETATGTFGSDQLAGRFEIGRAFNDGPLTVTPYAAIQAAQLWQAAYTETSTAGATPGVLGLSFASRSVSSLPTFLGTRFDSRVDLGNGMIWSPFANAAWVHEFSPGRDVTAALVNMPVPSFTVEGTRAAADSGWVELGSRLELNRWVELSGRVTGEFSRAAQSYSGIGSFKVSW